MKKMTDEKMNDVFWMYLKAHKLKTLLRTGWLEWGLDENIRHESVAEHVFGCLMLAISIFSNVQMKNLDKERVLMMLILHETEEIFIGDITPFDDERFTKKEKGREAVLKFFEKSSNSAEYLALIEEFEAQKTAESRFAYEIDKFEADIQAKIYEKDFHFENAEPKTINDQRIEKYRSEMGLDKVFEFFIEYDKSKFDEMFQSFTEKLKDFEVSEKE